MDKYNVFHRTWWTDNPAWPEGLEPHMGKKTGIEKGVSRDEAIKICKAWNETHKPGKYSRKAEFERA